MALNLPPPVNGSEDSPIHDTAMTSSSVDAQWADDAPADGKKSDLLLQGIIYPSKEIRSIIDKTAVAITKSPAPTMLEDRIREHQKKDPKFSFLADGDPYNRYYRYMIEKIREDGEEAALATSIATARKLAGSGSATPGAQPDGVEEQSDVQDQKKKMEALAKKMDEAKLEEPKPFEFAVDLPNVTAFDLDILRLTALFVAKRGRSFLQALSVREGRNYQFDFLRPTHSLYGYFNRMVEMYIKIMAPPEELLADLELQDEDAIDQGGEGTARTKWDILEEAKKRGEWDSVMKDKERKRKEEKEKEAIAFAEIDWQDFAVVQTIEFTSADTEIDLPPPTTIREMQSLSLNEKRMAAMIVEEQGDEDEQSEEKKGQGQQISRFGGQDEDAEMDMEEDGNEAEDEEAQEQKRRDQAEMERARAIQAQALGKAGMKIKSDYVPKGLAGRQQRNKVATTICPYCQQSIPENEISEHIRIELLDPKWKEQKQLLETKKTQAAMLMQGADVSASLKNLASARTDLFGTAADEEARKAQEAQEKAARKAKETIIWDGHTASKEKTLDTFQNKFTLDEQIASIHRRAQLVPNKDQNNVPGPQTGPQMVVPPVGPAYVPPAQAAGAMTPGGGTAFSGASISAGPSAATSFYPPPPPPQNQPGRYQPGGEQPEFDPSIFSMPPMPKQGENNLAVPTGGAAPGIHPSRLAQMGSGSPAPPVLPPPQGGVSVSPLPIGSPSPLPPPPVAGQSRPFDHDSSSPVGNVPKRPRIEDKLAPGQYYPEDEWIRMHPDPVNVMIQLPNVPEKPEWKLDGNVLTVPELPLNFLVATLRDRIAKLLDAPLPISRMKLDYGPKTLGNSATLASVNLSDGDTIHLSIRDTKKR